MSDARPLGGLFPLIPLSLTDNQEIDSGAVRANIELIARAGAPGLIAFGSMGQVANVTEEEFDAVTAIVTEAGREYDLQVVIGSTAPFQKQAIRRAVSARDFGADGTMLAVPHALPLTPEWAMAFYREVADELGDDFPIMVYNYPPLTGINITAEMWENDLLHIPSVKAVKESNSSLPHLDEVLLTIADRVKVFSGNDPAFWHASTLGAAGASGIFCWGALEIGVRFIHECLEGRQSAPWTLEAFAALQHLSATIRRPDMPSMLTHEYGYLNALVELAGGIAGSPRKPYRRLPDRAIIELKKSIQPLRDLLGE